jgi:Tfp pilus assembly protein PilF
MSSKKSETTKAVNATVGYKRPPVSGRFKEGHSGNPRGRPRGRSNVATLHKALFNEPIKVRDGGKSRTVPTGEAIFLLQTAKAGGGDQRSLYAVLDILDMTGRTREVSDEEREKRALHLPASYSMEEWDLMCNEVRQKDRERVRMQVEMDVKRFARPEDGTPTIVVPAAIQVGDRLAAEHKYDQALAAYQQEIAACKVDLTADSGDKNAQDRFRRAVSRIGLMADALLLASEFKQAIAMADLALEEAGTPFWINQMSPMSEQIPITGTTWIRTLQAHASMLSGNDAPARTFYTAFKSNPRNGMSSWETAVLRDFVRLRKAGLSHPLMDEIEKQYNDAGWTTDIRNSMANAPKLKRGEIGVYLSSEELKSGDKLLENGYVHEALTVYLRNLRNWQKNVTKDGTREDWKKNVAEAAERVALAIQELFRRGKFIAALENADTAVQLAPSNLFLQSVCACALLLRGEHDNESRTLFMRHCGKTVGDRTWEALIADHFATLRGMGCDRPLMKEIERRLAGTEVSEFPDVDVVPASKTTDPNAALMQASDIPSAEHLEKQGLWEPALVVYGRCLKQCEAKIAKFSKGVFNIQALDDRVTISNKLACLAAGFLMDRNFTKALESIDLALSANQSPLSNIWRAHALMFLDRIDEAKELYQRCRNEQVNDQPGSTCILGEFATLRKNGLDHPLMNEIESLFVLRTVSR